MLVQVSQYTFAMCSYKEKRSEPTEMMQLDGYTVDYIEANNGEYFLNLYSFLGRTSEGRESDVFFTRLLIMIPNFSNFKNKTTIEKIF